MNDERPQANPPDPTIIFETIKNLPNTATISEIKQALLAIPESQRNPRLFNEMIQRNILKPATIVTIVNCYFVQKIRPILPNQESIAYSIFSRQIIISQQSVDNFFKWLEETTFPDKNSQPDNQTQTQGWLRRNLPWLFGKN